MANTKIANCKEYDVRHGLLGPWWKLKQVLKLIGEDFTNPRTQFYPSSVGIAVAYTKSILILWQTHGEATIGNSPLLIVITTKFLQAVAQTKLAGGTTGAAHLR